MARVLIVAYYFPPIGGIGSIRMARFVELLPEFGWEPTVITPRYTPHATDERLPVAAERVVRAPSIELSRLGRAVPHSGRDSKVAEPGRWSLHSGLRSSAHRFVFYPDAQLGWYPGATLAGVQTLRGERFDAIYSSSNPITAHLVARMLRRRSGVPWAAEFRDPWADRLARHHPYRKHAARLQSRLVRSAERVIVPTPGMARAFEARYEREISLVPNGHDIAADATFTPAQPTLTYVGTYYPGRQDLRAVWRALEQLRRDQPHAVPRVRFVGDMPAELHQEIQDAGLGDLLDVTGFLPHESAMAAMQSSSMLLAAGFAGVDTLSRGVIPAKVFEYLASGLPILYLGTPDDDAGALLHGQPGCHVVAPGDLDGVRNALLTDVGRRYERNVEHYSRRARARALAGILDSVGR